MEFRDLKKQYQVLKTKIDAGIADVLASARFISGPQVKELEQRLADYVGVKHCITCANGTDAITLGLMAWNIGEGDAIFVPDFTFFSSGECPAYEGATPIYVDVERESFNMDPDKLEAAIRKLLAEGKYVPKAVISVDLFGRPADYSRIRAICDKYGLYLMEDAAQGFGGSIDGHMACSFGDISTTSFFPAKPLGCYGDGGAIFTDNDEWAALIRSLTVHGKNGNDKYDNIRIGMNSRLDTLQAAILLPKLDAFEKYEVADVNAVAAKYNRLLENSCLELPIIPEGVVSSWAQYTVILPEGVDRVALQTKMKEAGIPTMVYYAKPMHLQGAFSGTDSAAADCPVTEYLCGHVLSLPIHPYMEGSDIELVCRKLLEYINV
ncbi:MAG: DegT/DnrJ/EryC1/StrS family aminotransferase [Oscillospiraceae bacterium]|nr:DegT/DnrJ/EryC1/StrS family aminotransferase [Oscillospiraceae bacterium]